MAHRVLVVYGTKYGSTAAIAETIGGELEKAGLVVNVRPASQADAPMAYDAVVIGSAVYAGRWRKDAARYLQAHEEVLATRPVWLFNSGPLGKGDAAELAGPVGVPSEVRAVAERIRARDVAVFHGAIDATKLNPLERLMLRMVKSPCGDFRDWEAITAWARGIAATLTAETAPN